MPATIIPFVPRNAVRKAQPSDLEELLRMGLAFCTASGIPFDRQTMTGFAQDSMSNADRILLVAQGGQSLVGMVVGYVHPLFTCNGVRSATELAWWVDVDARGTGAALQLLQAFEVWARQVGADYVSVAAEAKLDGDRVGKLYQRAGFSLQELTYTKRIKE